MSGRGANIRQGQLSFAPQNHSAGGAVHAQEPGQVRRFHVACVQKLFQGVQRGDFGGFELRVFRFVILDEPKGLRA